jgi:thiamine-phosphate pyrophosphorylase
MMRTSSPELKQFLRLYLLADSGLMPPERLPEVVSRAIEGGVTLVQLRMKGATTIEQIGVARRLLRVCQPSSVPLLVNDRVDVALAAGTDGVHVGHIGEEDMEPADARRLVGRDALVGVSVGSAGEAKMAEAAGASYVSAGPMFSTTTKSNAGPPMGVALLQAVRGATHLPLVVIGGITAERAASLYEAGADGVCVGSAIMCAADPRAAAQAFARAYKGE